MAWYFEKRKAPKAVPGATRKAYGTTWWGQQWLQALSNIDYSNRLPRGKMYANKGLARDLELKGNTIAAKVTGSQPKPYRVQITVPAFDQGDKERLLQVVTDNPLFLSKLLNRELPPPLNEACLAAGISLFPRRWADLKGYCSCPDHAVPCKHMAAVLYLIANEIDKNPFVVFDLHGFDLVAALGESGYAEAGSESVPVTRLSQLQQAVVSGSAPNISEEALWTVPDFSLVPECRENLLRLLTDKPVFYPEGDFKKTLAALYKRTAASRERVAGAVPDLSAAQLHALQATETAVLTLDAQDASFIGVLFLDSRRESVCEFYSMEELVFFMEGLPSGQVELASPALRALHLAYQCADMLARRGAMVPQILSLATEKEAMPAYLIRTVPALLNAEVRAVCEQTGALLPPGLLSYVGQKESFEPVPGDYTVAVLSLFLGYFTEQAAEKTAQEGELPRWFSSGCPMVFDRFENREYPKNIQLWLSRFFLAEKDFVPVFEVRDQEALFEVSVGIEDKTAPLQAPVPLELIFTAKQYARLRLEALRDLSMVAECFPALNNLIASKGKDRLRFDSRDFAEVFFQALPVIRLFGIRVLLPKALQKLLLPAVSMSLSVKGAGKVPGTGLLSFANMIDFQWKIALGDQVLSREEFLKLVRNLRGIVRLAGEYVYVDDKEIAALLERIDQMPAPSGPRLLQIALAGEYQGVPVQLDESLRALIADLLRPDAVALPVGLRASLRPYQLRGFEWLYKNTRLGFGSLIADDMGLGKTLQVIATLQRLKEDGELSGERKALVVAPTTLLTNWMKEMARFAPGLSAHVYHGPGRSLAPLAGADVLLTTYGVVRSEIAALQKKDWLVAVIDEAQNIKNMQTAQTKAVRKLNAPVRIAMSGTPVENRLSEYYSLFEFANRGYLGTPKEFAQEYAKPIELERNRAALDRFRSITAPFLLRRLKTDKNVISDLPDKIETDQFCTLMPEQAALYQNVVDESLRAIENEKEGDIKRQGLVLKMMTALKQVCNHPAHFLKKTAADPALSGKTQLLLDLLAQILDSGEKTLIFTQYREMGDLLLPLLREQLGIEAAFLHGGVSRKGRDEMVDAFQSRHSERILLLSLKAGGTGLNLTAASNVIHYDLWWNPAVEAQATDRAFRIGQQRNVQVHRFITQGTFEEKINAMLQSKKELANLTVAAGEKWVGELSDAELRALVKLG
jgi:uncharacterized Zn finger protein